MSTTGEEKVGKPQFRAELRRRISKSPMEMLASMLGNDARDRVRSMNDLLDDNATESDSLEVPEVSLRALQLDEDADQEFIFMIRVSAAASFVVTDKGNDGWYVVGRFDYWWHYDAERAERVLEVHHPFLQFRRILGGTGVASTTVELYRLWQGHLHKTTELPEEGYAVRYGTDPLETITTNNRIVFRHDSFSPWTSIEFHKEETRGFEGEEGGKPVRKPIEKRSCTGYEWVPATLSFAVTRHATRALCR